MQKNEKRPQKSSKNKMFVFALCLTSDDWPSNLSDEPSLKCQNNEKRSLKSLKNEMDYIQLLMIGQAIQVKNVN